MRARVGSFWTAALVLAGSYGCTAKDAAPEPVHPSERAWSALETVEQTQLSLLVQAARDPEGNAMVVWDDLEGKVRAQRYDAASETWSSSALLDEDNPEDAAAPSVAVDGAGNAMAVWQRQSQVDDRRSVWTSRYDVRAGRWDEAVLIENSELVLVPQIAMDHAGNAVLAFTVAALDAPVATAHYDAERGTWSAAGPLAPSHGLRQGAPRVALAPGGDGIAVWMAGDLETATIWTARHDTSSHAWSDARAISPAADMAMPTDVAINEAGAAIALWVQRTDERFAVWTSRSEAIGSDWTAPERIDLDEGGDALLPQVALDRVGNALVSWSADDGTRQNVWANRFSVAEGRWLGAELIESGDSDAFAPRVGSDAEGNVFAVWTGEGPSGQSPRARWYAVADAAWGPVQELHSAASGESGPLELSVSLDGRALAIWSQDGSSLVAKHFR